MDFFEIDFLPVGEKRSGDAIALRYGDLDTDNKWVHVVDGGFTDDGQKVVDLINDHYERPATIDHVVLSHPDGDHAAGLSTVLENFEVHNLWMNRPWEFVDDLVERFSYEYTLDGLRSRLRKNFPFIAKLEDQANDLDIPIHDAFQGAQIGEFIVLAPSYNRYLDCIVDSEKTPEALREATVLGRIFEATVSVWESIAAAWGEENLKGDTDGTSAENESSIVQFAELCGKKILLTADAGVEALSEAIVFAEAVGMEFPGVDYFQVPHHGSRRNLSTEVADRLLGDRFVAPSEQSTFKAIVSANKEDPDHPRKAVTRAMIHRGAKVYSTQQGSFCSGHRRPERTGWVAATPLEYPSDQED